MATRSMVVIRSSGARQSHINLYRHWDGYPAEAGAALVTALAPRHNSPCDVVRRLVELREEGDPTRYVYEPALWEPSDQGDLEYIYVATFNEERGAWDVEVRARGAWENAKNDWRTWPGGRHTLAEFVQVVNRDRAEINARARSRGSEEAYPLLDPEAVKA